MLDLHLAEEGGLELRRGDVPVREVVEEIVRHARLRATRDGTRVEWRLRADPGRRRLDPEILRRIMDNLLDNALQHGRAGGTVVVELGVDDSDAVRVTVEDDGAGLTPAQQREVFEPRIRVGERGGWGLGLAFCRLAVRAHGGWIRAETPDGGTGARFTFVLPRVDDGP